MEHEGSLPHSLSWATSIRSFLIPVLEDPLQYYPTVSVRCFEFRRTVSNVPFLCILTLFTGPRRKIDWGGPCTGYVSRGYIHVKNQYDSPFKFISSPSCHKPETSHCLSGIIKTWTAWWQFGAHFFPPSKSHLLHKPVPHILLPVLHYPHFALYVSAWNQQSCWQSNYIICAYDILFL